MPSTLGPPGRCNMEVQYYTKVVWPLVRVLIDLLCGHGLIDLPYQVVALSCSSSNINWVDG